MRRNEHRIKNGVEEKHCYKCETWKPLDDFGIDNMMWDGLAFYCKKCVNKVSKQYRRDYPEKRKASTRNYYLNNLEKCKEATEKYCRNNPEKRDETVRRWQKSNPDKIRQYKKTTKARRYLSPKNRLCDRLGSYISRSLQGNKNGIHWETLVGWKIQDLIRHLEYLFQLGMTWSNYGKWHIDHKVPVSVFNFTSPGHADFKRCWALSNLQPMWAGDNIKKSAKLDKPFQPNLAI